MRPLTPSSIKPPLAPYSHGMEVPAGARLAFCSGQVGIAPDGSIPEGTGAQAEQCFANIAAILAEAGMDFSNVIRINAYVTGREHLQAYMDVRNGLFSPPYPASTLMIVSGFARPELTVEIEVVAAHSA